MREFGNDYNLLQPRGDNRGFADLAPSNDEIIERKTLSRGEKITIFIAVLAIFISCLSYALIHPLDKLKIKDMQKAAEFRGGECVSKKLGKDMYTPIKWKCHCGHEFEMSPNLVLKGGHWCPECLPMPWNYDEIAKHNPFFAQVWYSHHAKDENNVYTDDIYYAYSKD